MYAEVFVDTSADRTCMFCPVTQAADETEDEYDEAAADVDSVAIGKVLCITVDSFHSITRGQCNLVKLHRMHCTAHTACVGLCNYSHS